MAIDTDQNHDVPQLRQIDFTALKNMNNEELDSIEFQGAFMNLLGVLTRPDIIVFMGRLQRYGATGHRLDRHQPASEGEAHSLQHEVRAEHAAGVYRVCSRQCLSCGRREVRRDIRSLART
jgi:hypothetical protein